MSESKLQDVASYAKRHLSETIDELCEYLRIPAISCEPGHADDVALLAKKIEGRLEGLGFSAQVRHLEGALPLVSAERRCANEGAPTLLIYGHLDLQPVEGEVWKTPPHEPTRVKGEDGERLYARGAADDMGGWVSHLAALVAWLEVTGELPLHVKLVIEGEEEIGSPHLEQYMKAFPEDFSADVMVLTDCENPSLELPGLTTSLRGLFEVEVSVEALESDVHSGVWGNMAPDVSNALVHLLARLTDENGRPTFCRQEVSKAFQDSAAKLPLDDATIRAGAHVVDGVAVLPTGERSAAEWLWRQPALTILSTTLPRPEQHKNALRAQASASLSVRIPPGVKREEISSAIEALLSSDVPAGVKLSLKESPADAQSWLYEPQGPAFEAADRAYEKAWGTPLVQIGIGGSIPFVALFAKRYAHLPLILNGVMDPKTGAHGPNESLHLAVFEKAIAANVFLYDELSRVEFKSV